MKRPRKIEINAGAPFYTTKVRTSDAVNHFAPSATNAKGDFAANGALGRPGSLNEGGI